MTDKYPLSASQLKTADWCMLQYYLNYLSDYEPTKGEADHLKLGNLVHDTIENALPRDVSSANLGVLERRFEAVMQDQVDKKGLDRDEDAEIIDDAQRNLGAAARYIRKRCEGTDVDPASSDEPIEITGVEEWIEYSPDRDDFQYPMRAKIDIVSETSGEIWDWKTGSQRDEWIQAMVYYAAFAAEYGREPERVVFVYLDESDAQNVVFNDYTPGREEWEALLEEAKELLAAKESGEFPADVEDKSKCYHCDYEFHCPESPTGHGKMPWEAY